MLIDSHHHLWQYSSEEYPWISDQMSVLKQDFWSEQLQLLAKENEIDGFVTVQARQSLNETQSLLDLAEHVSLIRGVVGWVDFRSPEVASQLDRFAANKALRGLRHVVQDESDDQFILGKAFNRGIAQLEGRDLVYDVLIFAKHLEPSVKFVRSHPNIPMVLDHIAKPTIRAADFHMQWKNDLLKLAECENVVCKFSGVATEVRDSEWSIDTIRPYWDTALDAFTPKRLMFGSDWPVCLLRTGYQQWLKTVRELAAELTESEQEQLFSTNAIKYYRLEQN
ncbi:amidohydrolase family protein [Roseiconus lacunae]|uniref:Amidohydrolase family protein n=1 Tax=Roseiconus lacunae TaxID=2605694 RepID=A0ABT7PDU4_9BACT|nr:amidohydrolase family protein [Roseiconus lacunae]MDM4014660.1 amidohydrolase family protein [Roseiconus lacunae]